jgi:hypothetical protein
MQAVARRLSSLGYLARPLALTFLGIVLISLGFTYIVIHVYRTVEVSPVVYYLTLQFVPQLWRGLLFLLGGLTVLGLGIWRLSDVAVISLRDQARAEGSELVLGYERARKHTRVTVLSGGAGMLILAPLARKIERLTCITPLQDAIEYYYRASGLFDNHNLYYVVPTPTPLQVMATLDDGTQIDVMHVDQNEQLVERHVVELTLQPRTPGCEAPQELPAGQSIGLTRLARESISDADAIILGPGSLFESILPNLLLDEMREFLQQSKARKIYICNLMTEPGLTTGFGVADHIRQFKRYGGFVPDYVLVNVQRIDPAISQIYAAAHQSPVFLSPDEYEETIVAPGDSSARRQLIVEGSVIIETDLASSVVQYTASLKQPGESRAVRVLRHDQEKLTEALLELLKRT